MGGAPGIAITLALAVPTPDASPDFHPGIGYMVSQARQPQTKPNPPPASAVRPAPPPPPNALALAPTGSPPTVLERFRASRRVRGMAIGAAIAAQAGMIIYGVATLLAQRGEADAERERLYGDVPDWDPYPR